MLQILPKERGLGYTLNVNHFEDYTNKFPHAYQELKDKFDVKNEGYWVNFYYREDSSIIKHWINEERSVDAFSPNLNKELHIGHARGFINSIFLQQCCGFHLVSLLGKSLGELPGAEKNFDELNNKFGLIVTKYFDTHLPLAKLELKEKEGAEYLNNVVMIRSNGKPTYAYYEMLFNEHVKPDLIFTGVEQSDHFASLGLDHKHIPLGLIVSEKGKRSSRTGEAIKLTDFINEIASNFPDNPDKEKIAWNIVIGKVNSCNISQNIKYNLDQWLDLKNSKGLYITYTMCRIKKLLSNCEVLVKTLPNETKFRLFSPFTLARDRAIQNLQPNELLDSVFQICKMANNLYEKEKVVGNEELETLFHHYYRIISLGSLFLGIRKVEMI